MAHSISTIKDGLETIMMEQPNESKIVLDNCINLQPNTIDLLRDIFQILCGHYKKRDYSPSYVEYDGLLPKNTIHSHRAYYFPSHIQDHISNTDCKTYQYNLKIQSREIIIDIVCFKEEDYSRELCNHGEMIRLIHAWLLIATTRIPTTCSRNLHVYIYLTDFKKLIPSHNEDHSISVNNVNSAYTTSCNVNTNIVIYRKEEWFKVFIHETFHCLGLDFSHSSFNHTHSINRHFGFQNVDYKVFESYCETWARIMNVCFSSFLTLSPKSMNNSKINFMEYCTQFSYYMYYENLFSAMQMNKVLRHHTIQFKDIMKRQNQTHIMELDKYRETTAVLSYYVFTGILMNNFQSFIEWCSKYHKENCNIFQFNDTNTNIESFCHFIARCSRQKNVLKLQSIFQQGKYTTNHNTMMMTYIPTPCSIDHQFDVIV